MIRTSSHLSDEALLLAADGELSARRLNRALRHLAECSACRGRLMRIEQAIADLSLAAQTHDHRQLPSAGPARARLARRMAASSRRQGHPLRLFAPPAWRIHRRWLCGWAVVILAVASALLVYGQRPPLRTAPSDANGAFLLPRADLTPGAAAPMKLQEVCGLDRFGRTHPIPSAVHEAVFKQYGADYRRAAEYELDYLITPELGGIADARNLWPQPFSGTPWNAYVKDELERLFHRLVCEGEIDLVTAQRQMAGDWISAYKRYFGTERPIRDYDAQPLTALDRELILAELGELGISPSQSVRGDGAMLMAMLEKAKKTSHQMEPRMTVKLALFRPAR